MTKKGPTKVCAICESEKDRSEFSSRMNNGYQCEMAYCKPCMRDYLKKYRPAMYEKRRLKRQQLKEAS